MYDNISILTRLTHTGGDLTAKNVLVAQPLPDFIVSPRESILDKKVPI